ncbi:rCG36672 [Rattus norvegicus]|uniref:RCG36672 n=1 Tax=Rattus norvegicus TaxID=10116 RepID=A6JS66_RAT|nr:rCG36672 [Rattus norvegicus]
MAFLSLKIKKCGAGDLAQW